MRTIALALFLAAAASGVAAAQPVEIAPNVFLLRGELVPGQQPDGNSILFVGKKDITVVDTGRHVEHTRAILDFAAAKKKPVANVINTHWHLDHIGGNVLLRREVPKAKIYASGALDDALQGFLASYRKQLEANEKTHGDLALIQAGDALKPDVVVSKPLKLGALQINIAGHAATAADLWMYDAKTRTLIAGDLITLPFPFLDTACPKGWEDALAQLAKVDFKLVVPGHGAPMTRSQFDAYRAAYVSLVSCDRSVLECSNAWIASVNVPEKDRDFVRQALDYYITNFLRPISTKYCG